MGVCFWGGGGSEGEGGLERRKHEERILNLASVYSQ